MALDPCRDLDVLEMERELLEKRIREVEREITRLRKLRYSLRARLRSVEKRIENLRRFCPE